MLVAGVAQLLDFTGDLRGNARTFIRSEHFKDARLLCSLSVPDAGKLFRVSERTVRNWEAGRVRIPYTAFKLMRILRGYELPGHHWKGYRLIGDTLWSPEGLAFRASDQTWWSLTVRMAHEFRRMMAAQRTKGGQAGGVAAASPTLAAGDRERRNGAGFTGLVYSSTSHTEISETAVNQGPEIAGPSPVVDLELAA